MSDYTPLFLANKRAIARAAYLACPRWMELEDWTSEMMLRVWSRISSYNPNKGKFTTWVYVIAFRFAAQQKAARSALKRSAHATKSMHCIRDNGSEYSSEPIDYRVEPVEAMDMRLDVAAAIAKMIPSDREVLQNIMSGEREGQFAKQKGFSRQRYNHLRERALARLHRRLWGTGHGPKVNGQSL
jgi:RNA polymerase sigma factor (sigma-70 family)